MCERKIKEHGLLDERFIVRGCVLIVSVLSLLANLPAVAAPGSNDVAKLLALEHKMDRLYSDRKFKEALLVAQEGLALTEQAFGPDHTQTASSAFTLGRIYKALEDYGKAEELFQRSLKINEKALNPNHRQVASELNNLAELYVAIHQYAKAEVLYHRALKIREAAQPPDDDDTAAVVTNLGTLYFSMGAFAKAEQFYQRALSIHDKPPGSSDPKVATDLTNLAAVYKKLGQFDKSETLYKRVLEMVEKAVGEESRATATAVASLGRLYHDVGDYRKAQPLFERALRIVEKALGPDSAETATALNNLAQLYHSTNEYAKAEPLLERALKIMEKVFGPDHTETATFLNNLGELYAAEGLYGKARPLVLRALTIREKTLGPDDPVTLGSFNNLAELHRVRGEYTEAERLFQRAVQNFEKRPDSASPEMGKVLSNWAYLYYLKGDTARAESMYRRALEMKEKAAGPDHPDTAVTLCDFAKVYDFIGDYKKAEALYQRALKIAEKALSPDHSHTSTYLLGLAETYYHAGNYAKAEPLCRRALASKEKTLGPTHPHVGAVLDQLAGIEVLLGNYAEAESLYQRSRKMGETPSNLKGLARLYRARGENAQAVQLYQRSLTMTQSWSGPDHPDTGSIVTELASLKVEEGDTADALALIKRALETQEKTLSNILSFTSEQQRLAFQKTLDPYSILASLGNATELAQVVLRQKGLVLDSLLEDRLFAQASADPRQREAIDQLRRAKERLTQLLLEVPKDLTEAKRESDEEKEKLGRQVEELEAKLARQVSGSGKPRRALTVTVKQVQAALPPHSVLLEFVRYSQYRPKEKVPELSFGAVVLAANAEPKYVTLGSAAEIKKTVTLYQKSARGETDQITLSNTLRRLTEQVWLPIEKEFPPGVTTVIISPDADLSFISFAALVTPDDKFVSEKYSVRYVASGRDLLKEPKDADQKTTMRIFANPDFAATTASSGNVPGESGPLRSVEMRNLQSIALPNLPGTEKESRELESLARQTSWEMKTSLGRGASEAELRKVDSPRILHLATHGFFLPEPTPQLGVRMDPPSLNEASKASLLNPMHRSGLAVAGATNTLQAWGRGEAPSPDNDGIVTAEEVGSLKLDGTWLVVLSACDTGSGEAKAGEGVLGLRRGFIQAGSRNLLMTLWPISDDTTVRIMLDFYSAAFKTGNAPQALADTQRDWLVKLRKEQGLLAAVRLAGPFIMSCQGIQ
jgi:tetratricopeptide (TPR) repeat protein